MSDEKKKISGVYSSKMDKTTKIGKSYVSIKVDELFFNCFDTELIKEVEALNLNDVVCVEFEEKVVGDKVFRNILSVTKESPVEVEEVREKNVEDLPKRVDSLSPAFHGMCINLTWKYLIEKSTNPITYEVFSKRYDMIFDWAIKKREDLESRGFQIGGY